MKIPGGGIAFFDSGVGGLTVLNSCQKRFINETFYYYGDNKRAPYGNLPSALIRRYVNEGFDLFEKLQVKAVVLACNTVTALCIDDLRARYTFPIIGAEPAITSAAKDGGEIFVLTTRATFNSIRFRALCEKVSQKYPQARLKLYACDGLAGEIEEHFTDAFYDFTRFLPRGSPRAVVLGCTHYVYIKERIAAFCGCEVFDGNEGIARRLCVKLQRENIACVAQKQAQKKLKVEKSRDERPLFQKDLGEIGKIDHFLSPNTEKIKTNKNANKCSCIKTPKSLIICGVERKNEIYFLGSGAQKNKEFYERMFVF